MLRITEVRLPLDHPEARFSAAILKRLGIAAGELIGFTVFRRAVDARKPAIAFTYTLDVEVRNEAGAARSASNGDRHVTRAPDTSYRFVAQAPAALAARPVVIGTGPCGLFAGLMLAQMGFRPLILERGKVVRERTKDTWGLWRKSVLNPESNVQFGEGGAGTFSDGKLYSQIKDPRHLGRKVLTEFVKAGAPAEILYVSQAAHRHVPAGRHGGEACARPSIALGGEIRFESRVDDIEIDDGQVRGVVLAGGERIATDHVVLAVGHSARDTFQMLHERGVYIEAKPFSIGFRIEHPQSLIDRARYGRQRRQPAARRGRLQARAPRQQRPLGLQLLHVPRRHRGRRRLGAGPRRHQRHEPVFAQRAQRQQRHRRRHHAGRLSRRASPLAGIEFQRHWEARAFELGGSNYDAPGAAGRRLPGGQAVDGASARSLPSYTPGRAPRPTSARPARLRHRRRSAKRCRRSTKQIKGFAMPDAVLTGVETRTSSPIRIKRGDDCQSINTRGLYPPAKARATRADTVGGRRRHQGRGGGGVEHCRPGSSRIGRGSNARVRFT